MKDRFLILHEAHDGSECLINVTDIRGLRGAGNTTCVYFKYQSSFAVQETVSEIYEILKDYHLILNERKE